MEGRWTIYVGENDEYITDMVIPSNNDRRVPVVPCDDAAIERAARMLCHEGMSFADGWVQGDTDRDYPRLIAEAVLRAAGTP